MTSSHTQLNSPELLKSFETLLCLGLVLNQKNGTVFFPEPETDFSTCLAEEPHLRSCLVGSLTGGTTQPTAVLCGKRKVRDPNSKTNGSAWCHCQIITQYRFGTRRPLKSSAVHAAVIKTPSAPEEALHALASLPCAPRRPHQCRARRGRPRRLQLLAKPYLADDSAPEDERAPEAASRSARALLSPRRAPPRWRHFDGHIGILH